VLAARVDATKKPKIAAKKAGAHFFLRVNHISVYQAYLKKRPILTYFVHPIYQEDICQ